MSDLRLPYELRIGVTGHRTLPDPAAVEHAVEGLLAHLQGVFQRASEFPLGKASSHRGWSRWCDRFLLCATKLFWRGLPTTGKHVPADQWTPLRWVVVSPLAKGADRIVARAVLKQSQEAGQPRLQVVTPFSLDDYRRDFAEPADLAEFEELLAHDPAPTALPNDYGLSQPTDSEEVIASKKKRRNEGYFAVGKRVIDASEILIVIWNGQPAAGHGGTGEIVQYAVDQGRTVLWIDSNQPDQLPRIIVGRAPEKPGPDDTVVEGLLHRPLPNQATSYSRLFHRLAAYNRAPAFDAKKYQEVFDKNWCKLSKTAADSALPYEAIGPVLEVLLPNYARADQLAARYQELYLFAALWLQRLSSIAVSVVVFQVLFFPEWLWMILLEILAMLLAVVLLRISRREAWHEKWLRDRHLAERLRIAMFTTLTKSGRNSQPRPDETLPFYQSPDDWIVETCERLAAVARDKHTAVVEFEPLKRFIIAAWLEVQATYHKGNAKRKGGAAHKAHLQGLIVFCVTMLMALLHWLGVGHAAAGEHHGFGIVGQLITLLAIVLPAWGATIHSVNTLLERERISTRSAQMAKVLAQLVREAKQANTPEEFASVISQAEEPMLMENHEWWVSLSFHPPILPA